MKRPTAAERRTLNAFRDEWPICWACCWSPGVPDDTGMRWPGLETHHLIKPGRRNERWNLARLCHLCHMLAEGERVTIVHRQRRVALPKLDLAHLLWLKRRLDPKHYDRRAMASASLRLLPRPKKPPAWFNRQRCWWFFVAEIIDNDHVGEVA